MSEGELYPQTSKLLKLPKCLPKDCNEVGDEVIIETKFNTVKGLIHSIDGNGNLKLSYNAVDAGYPDCYQLEQCDVVSIRCYSCCDDRYFELESCEPLTCDIISAALGASSPKLVGNIFLYSGDLNEPDCLWKWNGLNDIGKPENWIDQYGDLAAQFTNLDTDPAQLCSFLTWLSEQFSGVGIAFNVSQYCDSIIVTVGDGSDTAPATFTYSYSGGRISLDANDGSGRKDANVIVRGAGPPTEPYNWFFYINTNTGGVFINNNGDAELLGIIDLEGSNSCADIIACVATNIEAGEPDPDRWAMPQVTTNGSTWIIESVVYKPGETTLSANFSTCSYGATTLDELVDALNSCNNNPDGWVWVNSGGVLTLCTPVGDNVLTVTYDVGSGSQVINFNGVPTVAGEDRVDLCKELADCIVERNLLDEHIQAGDIMLSTPYILKDLAQNESFNDSEPVAGVDVIPADAVAVTLAVIAFASTGYALVRIYNDHYLPSDPTKNPYTIIGYNENNIGDIRHWKVKLRSDGSLGIQSSVADSAGSFSRIIVLSYSK